MRLAVRHNTVRKAKAKAAGRLDMPVLR